MMKIQNSQLIINNLQLLRVYSLAKVENKGSSPKVVGKGRVRKLAAERRNICSSKATPCIESPSGAQHQSSNEKSEALPRFFCFRMENQPSNVLEDEETSRLISANSASVKSLHFPFGTSRLMFMMRILFRLTTL